MKSKTWQEILGGHPLTGAERQAELKRRRIEAGQVRREYWATPEQHERLKKYLARLK